jgi:hypothetical protein
MRDKSVYVTLLIGLVMVLPLTVFISTDFTNLNALGAVPVLEEQDVYVYEGYNTELEQWVVVFEIIYYEAEGEEGEVILHIDGQDFTMEQDRNEDVTEGRYFWIEMVPETIQDEDTFFFSAIDESQESTNLGTNDDPFFVGDYMGWGEKPILSNPDVYYDEGDNDYVFSVTYSDPEGDPGYLTVYTFNFEGTDSRSFEMHPTGGNTLEGQSFEVAISDTEIEENWYFYIEAYDEAGSTTYLPDQSQEALLISEVISEDDGNGGGGSGNGGGQGFALPEWLTNAEVVVGIIGLVAIGAGSAYGVYRRKKKHGRFSELLTQLDEIYVSYKLNPKRCELELEKIKGTINEDLKKSTIDDNNYSILKGRIDEILSEIRSESLRSEVAELPKDIELKIKDMLIDGEITREEYDKILPIIKGSSMTSDDKEKVKKMVESYMVEEKKE